MPHNMIIMDILIVFFAIGVGIGIVGSVISLKKYLKV
jgi:cell division protein FtsX